MKTINPYTNEVVEEFDNHKMKEVREALQKGKEAFQTYKNAAFPLRTKVMTRVADILEENQDEYAHTITEEMGKPITQSVSEVQKCAHLCRYYAEHVKLFLKDDQIKTEASESFVSYQPLGIILGVMPWNFPFWQVFRFSVPALMAGNVCLLKHAPRVPKCALAIEDIYRKAGFEEGVFQSIFIPAKKVKTVIKDEGVQGVTLTGSTRAGASVAAEAGRNIKKTVLELGGSDPFIVLDDANVKEAVKTGAFSRLLNTGQSCIAAKRFIIHESVEDDFVSLLKEEFKDYKLGDPTDEDVKLGPLAREDLAEKLEKQVNESMEQGAKVIYGGGRPDRKGAFYNPTILTNIEEGMPAYEEELFGPVATIFTVSDTDEAIELANDTEYGLGASLWTTDKEKATRLAKRIEAGNVFVNSLVKSDPRLPFGGIKKSGFGRELSSHGIKEFTNRKTIWVE